MATAAADRVLAAELAALPAVTVHPAVGGQVVFTVAGVATRPFARRLAELGVADVGVAGVPAAAQARGWPAEAVTVAAGGGGDGRLVAAAVAWTIAGAAADAAAAPGTDPSGSAR